MTTTTAPPAPAAPRADPRARRRGRAAVKRQGWIRRLVGYMKPHKKNAYIAFGVAIGGQLIQSLLPVVQKIVVDDVITPHTSKRPPHPGQAARAAGSR